MTIEKLTEEETSALDRGDALDRDGRKALRIIAAQAERIASLERECNEHVLNWSKCQGRLEAATARAEAADLRSQSWERGHDYAWSEKQRAEERLAAAENEMRRIGYGEELIYCFDANGKPTHTSRVGDLSWDTRENRARTFQFISDTLERDRDASGTSARAEHLQVHGLDPAEIEVDSMFLCREDDPSCRD